MQFFCVHIIYLKRSTQQHGCVGLERFDIRLLLPTLKIVRPYLPQRIVSQIECVFGKHSPTRVQLREITKLGESVGLEKSEVIAAIDAPLSNQGMPIQGRASKLMRLILLSFLVVVSILIVWAVVDPASFPIYTYAPGTDYGTIRPQDFTNQYPTQLER